MLDIERIREDYPILGETVNGKPLIYLDNAATMQMAEPVLQTVMSHYRTRNGNVHRGVHELSRRSTEAMERARERCRAFINAASDEEIVFTSGTTGGINMIARMLSKCELRPGDEVAVSAMEHHSNLLPWQEACRRTGARLRIIPLTGSGELDMDAFRGLLCPRTKIVAVTWVSNVLGTVNPVHDIVRLAHEAGAAVLVDAAQAIKSEKPDVRELGCDFLAFSGHKLGALTGTGVLYGEKGWLERLTPDELGGGMVKSAGLYEAQYEAVPLKLEAGTPNYAGAVSLGAALEYLESIGAGEIEAREKALLELTEALLGVLPGVHILGSPARRRGCVSISADGVHPYDIGVLLDAQGIAVRTGHLCAQPLVESLGFDSVLRISPAFYNTEDELYAMQAALRRALAVLKGVGK